MRHLLRDLAVAAGAVVIWEFQEASGQVIDVSGNSRDSTSVSAGVDYGQAGPMDDRGMTLNGGESIQRNDEVSTVQNDFTIECIVNVTIAAANDQILVHNGGEGTNGWGIRIESAGQFRGLAGAIAELALGSVIEAAGYTMLHVRRDSADSNRWKYSVNGVETNANAGTTNPNAPNGTLQIGDDNLQHTWGHLAIYETCLSNDRIAQHYAAYKSILRRQAI